MSLSDAELLAALERNDWNRKVTAVDLGVQVETVRLRVKALRESGRFIPHDSSPRYCESPPTLEEIAATRDAIKNGWSPFERSRRVVGPKYGAEIPEIADPLGGTHEVKSYRI